MHEELITEIEAAFADVPYPGDDRIVVPCRGDTEVEEYREAFRGKHWREMTSAWLVWQFNAIHFFADEALRFFLPGYMIATISDPYRQGGVTLEAVIHSLTIPVEPPGFRANRPDPEDYTAGQLRAMAAFLRVVKETLDYEPYNVDGAIEYYLKAAENK